MTTALASQFIYYGLDLIDAITGGPIVGESEVVTTAMGTLPPFRAVSAGSTRWVFSNLPGPVPPALPTTFVISARHYVGQTLTTGTPALLNPTGAQPGYLAKVTMMPRTGYPFSPTLTRVIGIVRLATSVDPASPVVPNATVQITPAHYNVTPGTTTPDAPVSLTTTDDGQFTFWFRPVLAETPTIANQITNVTVSATVDGVTRSGSITTPFSLVPNGVTYAPTVLIS